MFCLPFLQGIMLVYSTSDQDSFLNVAQWKEEIEKVLNPIYTCTLRAVKAEPLLSDLRST